MTRRRRISAVNASDMRATSDNNRLTHQELMLRCILMVVVVVEGFLFNKLSIFNWPFIYSYYC